MEHYWRSRSFGGVQNAGGGINADGYGVFLVEESHDPQQVQQEDYVKHQQQYPIRVYHEFLKPLISRYAAKTLLDVGCGLGTEVREALKDGYDAFGFDLPNMTGYWRQAGNDPPRFFAGSAIRLPFAIGQFDFVWSLGVIEHIGTTSDTATLVHDYHQMRRDYAAEIMRVTRPGGKIVVSCPNHSFPIDIQHGPICNSHTNRLRWFINDKMGLNIHKTWGNYHLLSYAEVRRLFSTVPGFESIRPLPLRNYFGFGKFTTGYMRLIRPLVKFYVENLPSWLLTTCFNPYTLVIIEKKKTA